MLNSKKFKILFLILIFIEGLTPPQLLPVENFSLKRVVFITGASESFGDYSLKSNNLFGKGENLSLYFEPVHCTLKKIPRGYKAQIHAQAVLESVSNPGLTQTIEIGVMDFVVSRKDFSLYADITLMDVGKLPVDLYKISMTFGDVQTKQSVKFSKQFRVGPSYVQAMIATSAATPFKPKLKSISPIPRNTPRIYCIFKPRRVPKGAILKSVCIAESVAGHPPDFILETFTTEVQRFKQDHFFIDAPADGWAPGNYRLELFVNDEFEIVVNFAIK